MLLKMKTILVFLMTSVVINVTTTSPGFTVFKNDKGEYFNVIGPILGEVKLKVSHPPIHYSDIVEFRIEFTPSERIDSIFTKGRMFLHGFPVWSMEGTYDSCDGMTGEVACPFKAGVTYRYGFSYPIAKLSPISGWYKAEVTWFTITARGEKKNIMGTKLAFNLQRG